LKSTNNIIINSGGQTGVDRAALDFALSNGLVCKGWCPKGRLAEDGTINARYPLAETNTADSIVRTEMNIIDSDATLIVYIDEMDPGTLATRDYAFEHHKPLFIWKIGRNRNVNQFRQWLLDHRVNVLNVAGPRLSYAPDIYGETLELLESLLAEQVRSADSRMY
jgi:hypothetical protein